MQVTRNKLLLLLGALAALLLPSLSPAVTLYEKDDFKIRLSGYVQELSSSQDDTFAREINSFSRPLLGFSLYPEHIASNTTRCRTIFRVLTGTILSAEADIDWTYTFGSVLDSPFFRIQKELPPPTYWDLEYRYADGDGRYGTVSVYRAMITLEGQKARLVIGRQRLAYGTALFYSPIDIWNPVSPLALEPSEKIGVDGVSGLWWLNDKVTLTALAAMADEWDDARVAASGSFQVKSYTFDFLAGKRYEDGVYGFDFVGYLGQAGVRGEFTWTVAAEEDDYPRAVIGMDYAWPNSLYLAGEYYYNGGPIKLDLSVPNITTLPAPPFTPASIRDFIEPIVAKQLKPLIQADGVSSLNRNFAAGMGTYDLNPLVKGSLFGILDIDKGSWVLAPGLSWSASDNTSVDIGAQLFGGAEDGEFGAQDDLAWGRLRYDF